MTGVSDYVELGKLIDDFLKLYLDIKTFGTNYNTNEQNSLVQIEDLEKDLGEIGSTSNIPIAQYPSIFGDLPKWTVLLGFIIIIELSLDCFLRSEQGYLLKVTGNNRKLVKSLGKDPDAYIALGLILTNLLIGLSGGLMAN